MTRALLALLVISTSALWGSLGCAGECVARCVVTEATPPQRVTCVAYVGPYWDEDLSKDACKEASGVFKVDRCCPGDAVVGRCRLDANEIHETEVAYYGDQGWTADDARTDCEANKGEFTP